MHGLGVDVGVGVAHGGLIGEPMPGDGLQGSGVDVDVAHGGLIGEPMPGDGLHGCGVDVGVAQGGLIGDPMPGDGLHGCGVGVGEPHGGLTFGGGESGQPEFGMHRTRIAVSISPRSTTTLGCCEYASE